MAAWIVLSANTLCVLLWCLRRARGRRLAEARARHNLERRLAEMAAVGGKAVLP